MAMAKRQRRKERGRVIFIVVVFREGMMFENKFMMKRARQKTKHNTYENTKYVLSYAA